MKQYMIYNEKNMIEVQDDNVVNEILSDNN